jgi:multidrug efflux pump subunit AcrA (membrane-fusion protein)
MMSGPDRGAGLAAALAALLLAACDEAAEPVSEPPPRPVPTVILAPQPLHAHRLAAGVVRAGQRADLSFRVSGQVEAVDVAIGDAVRAGDAVARLDAAHLDLRVLQAEAAAQARPGMVAEVTLAPGS